MALEHQVESALASAVRSAGSQSAFGRIIGRRQSTVRGWLIAGKPLPAEHVLIVERAVGISKHELRPDLYPPMHPQRRGTTTMVDRGQHQLFGTDASR